MPASASRRSRRNQFFAATVSILFFSSIAFAQTAFVRVNQVGYPSGGSKRAYLMASSAETGATFLVKNSSGTTVFGPAAIGASLGSWSSAYPDIYPLDFDTFTTAGTYTISVSGSIAAASPSFKVDSATNVYTSALDNSLYFYQNERDGQNFVATPLRTAAGHLNDQSAKAYATPNMNSSGRFSGDLRGRTLPHPRARSRAWWLARLTESINLPNSMAAALCSRTTCSPTPRSSRPSI